MNRLENDDKNKLFKALMQFGYDSREQGATELVRKSILLNDMVKIDSIRMTTFAYDGEDIIREMTRGDACWFAHLTNADIWLPFDYDTQKQMEVIKCIKMDKPFRIDERIYYDNFEIRQNMNSTWLIKLSENLIIHIDQRKFDFKLMTDLTQVMKDIQFLEAMPYGKTFYIGERKICEYADVQLGDRIQQTINELKQLQLAINKFEIRIGKDFKNFTDKNWKEIDELLKIYQGKIRPKNETAWHMWWWEGRVVPFFLAFNPDGELCIENGTCFKHLRISVGSEGERYFVPSFIMFKRDIWENLYDVDEKILLEELEKGEFNKVTEGNFTHLFVEILSAYDMTKDEKYYNVVQVMLDKLLAIDSEADYLIINKLQLIKRKRDLYENEQKELENIEANTDDQKVVCAVNILLENKRTARKMLEEMSDEDKELFMTFPIYNLL